MIRLVIILTVTNGVFSYSSFFRSSNSLEQLVDAADYKTPQELVEENGYPFESHFITTSDGYILNLHRIPHGKNGISNGRVAFLQHGLILSSTDFILFPDSLGYILADIGYDVWMGNARGNMYSRNHSTLNPDRDATFWEFSWNEIGLTDLPTMIDYVINKTGVDGVYYVGHSQGTTVFYVMTSERPEYNNKIKVQVSLSPEAYVGHMKSPFFRIISHVINISSRLADLIGVNEFLPSEGMLSKVSKIICKGVVSVVCENVAFLICGFSPNQMNNERLPQILAHIPAGAATRQFLHYGQEIRSGHFRKYDFGLMKNLVKYNSIHPPDYDISKITSKVYLFYSGNDWLASIKDVERLYEALPNAVKVKNIDFSFNHLDFVYGIDSGELVNKRIAKFFNDN